MDKRKANVIFTKVGGNAGKGSFNTKISLPKTWVDSMGFKPDERQADLEFDGDTITIRKVDEDEKQD